MSNGQGKGGKGQREGRRRGRPFRNILVFSSQFQSLFLFYFELVFYRCYLNPSPNAFVRPLSSFVVLATLCRSTQSQPDLCGICSLAWSPSGPHNLHPWTYQKNPWPCSTRLVSTPHGPDLSVDSFELLARTDHLWTSRFFWQPATAMVRPKF